MVFQRICGLVTKLIICSLIALGAVSAHCQTPTPIPITGNLGVILGTPAPYAGLLVQLQNCASPTTIPGYSVIVQTGYQIQANASGVINSTIWPNDLIDCNGTTGNSQYQLSLIVNGSVAGVPQCYQVVSTQGTWNINTQQPITCGQSPPDPQDETYRNLNITGFLQANNADFTGDVHIEGNLVVDGTFTAPTLGPIVSPEVNGIYSILAGGDVCAKLNTLITSIGATTPATILIPPASYTCSATVQYDPSYISIIGAGVESVQIAAMSGAPTFYQSEPIFRFLGGELSGFTLSGNGSANQIGIRTGGIIFSKISRIMIQNFTGSGAIGLYTYNSTAVSDTGWFERNQLSELNLNNNTIGWKIQYNTSNAAAASFGYNDFDMKFGVNPGQVGIDENTGRVYNSTLHLIFNGAGGESGLIHVESAGDWDTNSYVFGAECQGGGGCPGVVIDDGGELTGTGYFNFPGFTNTNSNTGGLFSGRFRIVPQAQAMDIGSITNYGGSGNTATGNLLITTDPTNPYASFGGLIGNNVGSTYTTMLNIAGNAHSFFTCPPTYTGLSNCNEIARVDQLGDGIFTGYVKGATYRIGANTVIPLGVTGYNGAGGIWIQLNDGTGSNSFAVYKADGTLTNGPITSSVPSIGVPPVNKAACIKADGPPVVIGYCSTVVDSGGACTCN